MKRNFLHMLGLSALMMGGSGQDLSHFSTRTGTKKRSRSASQLTKKQKKARVRSKMAKKSRKINYKKSR